MEATTYQWITHPWEDTGSLSALWAEKCRKRPATQPYFLLLWTLTLCWDTLRVGGTLLIVQKVNNYAAKKNARRKTNSIEILFCKAAENSRCRHAVSITCSSKTKTKTLEQKIIKKHFIYASFSTTQELLLQTSPHCLSGFGCTIINSVWNKTTMQFPKCSSQLVFVPTVELMLHVLSRWANWSSWEAHRGEKKRRIRKVDQLNLLLRWTQSTQTSALCPVDAKQNVAFDRSQY